MTDTARRITASDAQQRVQGGKAVLVCAYDDESKCRQYDLPGAMHMNEMRSRAGSMPKDREIIFYCA